MLISLEILKTQNQHQEDSCAFSEVTRSCQYVGSARNRLQCHAVLRKLRFFLSMHVYAWTVFPLSLSGVWWLNCFTPYRTEQMDPRDSHEETRRQLCSQRCITPSQQNTPTSFQQTLIPFQQIQRSLIPVLCCLSQDKEAVIKMIFKGRSPTMMHFPRTLRVALDCFFHRMNLDPKIQIRYIDTKHQLADMLTQWNFTHD